MGFAYLAGTTDAAAPDEVVDWFATFQQWITAEIGWTVEAGGGTTDLILRSLGEAGGLTMLYMRVQRVALFPNRVSIEVRNDLAGTQVTTMGGYVDSAGAQFQYWMAGDLDSIVVCFRGGAVYRAVYAGLVMPFARTITDETYAMIATDDDLGDANILRRHDGAWDQNDQLYPDSYMEDGRLDTQDGSFTLGPLIFGAGAAIAGQLKHVSGEITDPTLVAGNTITTGQPGGTTSWIVLQGSGAARFAMRTGGVMPTGATAGGGFASVAGVAANYPALYGAVIALLTGVGWTDLGDPGIWTDGRMFYSVGESGLETIYGGLTRNGTELYANAWDDAIPTHQAEVLGTLAPVDFPVNYWITADKDEVVLVVARAGGYTYWYWGVGYVFAPGLPDTIYKNIAAKQGAGIGFEVEVLRRHDDAAWGADLVRGIAAVTPTNSNPNAYDGVSYIVWPIGFYERVIAPFIPYAQPKYIGFSHGGGIAPLDTIAVGAETWTVFFDSTPVNFCVRTA